MSNLAAVPKKNRFLKWFLTLSVPLLLVVGNVRLVMTPLFLQLEYTRSDFPEDFYGFTTEDRLQYAPFAVNYLLNGEDIDYLADLRFPDGKAMYNARELNHMRDVKAVTQAVYLATVGIAVLGATSIILLWRGGATEQIWRGLGRGAVLTLSLIAAIVIGAFLSWDIFFTTFHNLFFASGTWRFEYSDTLIRLFPEQFWFDAALVIGGLTIAESLLIAAWVWRVRASRDI